MVTLSGRLNAPLSAKQQRVLAIILLGVAVLLVLCITVLPVYLLYRHYSSALSEEQSILASYQRTAAQQTQLKNAIDSLNSKNGIRFYLKTSVPNLAGAELSDSVRSAIEGNGGRINSIQVAPSKDEGRYREITVNVQMFANAINFQKILNALESQPPYRFVDNLSMHSLIFRGYRPSPGVEPEINLQMDVSAFAKLGTN